jgi:hypothetical protein
MDITGIIITYIQARMLPHIGISVPKEILWHINQINIQIHQNSEILLLWKDLIVVVL